MQYSTIDGRSMAVRTRASYVMNIRHAYLAIAIFSGLQRE